MSHEGIRFISEEEAQRLAQETRIAICPRGDRTGTCPGAENYRNRHGDRLEGRPSEQLDVFLAAGCVSLRYLS